MSKKLQTAALEKAIASLELALNQNYSEFIRDSVIQRFEYTFELAWKAAKVALEIQGIQDTSSPRAVIRESARLAWLESAETWMGFLESRNLSSHIYKEEIAVRVYEAAKAFLPQVKRLLEKLKNLS